VSGLADSAEAAERLLHAGATPVMGDLLEAGPWQDKAAADCVFHIPPHPVWEPGVSGHERVRSRERLMMDSHLLDALSGAATRRIVYVADASYYGATRARPITEDAPAQPSDSGMCLAPALERLDGYVFAGLPIVTTFPGWVYGNGSWFRERVIDPVMSGRPLRLGARRGQEVSTIHVHDCARAMVHLAEHGEDGSRYFLVNNQPVAIRAFAATFARLANRPLRVGRMPAQTTRLDADGIIEDYLTLNAVYSNIRLRGTGFRFRFPTLEDGLQQVLGELDESMKRSVE
jgi:nucleoside-diphosphate-sugar epimerase